MLSGDGQWTFELHHLLEDPWGLRIYNFISNHMSISVHIGYVLILMNGEEIINIVGFWSISSPVIGCCSMWPTWYTGIDVGESV